VQQLNNIRSLRDDLLLRFSAGRAFSAWYYAIGPYGAEAIRGNEPAKAVVRVLLLNPLAELSRECAQAEKK
jgi:lipopolysaccharide biosynthesis protein